MPVAALRTIAALATAPGRSAVAIIRISGPDALSAAKRLSGRAEFMPRVAQLCALCDPATGERIDRGLMLWFPGPASFTGEDMVEFQLHGSRAVISSVLRALTNECGVELAEPGEFTRLAFQNGKLDLSQVEALADLIAAETEAQRRQANRQLAGALGEKAEAWRARLIKAAAYFEAAIDFPDDDIPADVIARAEPVLRQVATEIAFALKDGGVGERLREGLVVALIGAPNAGKSTLLNALARREAAIVSEQAGTTRDIIEVAMDLRGLPVVLLDTAGLRETSDPVESEGVRRTRARAEAADIRLVLCDPSADTQDWMELGIAPAKNDILVWTKSDLAPTGRQQSSWPGAALSISAKTGAGMNELVAAIADRAARLLTAESAPLITRQRHRQELERTRMALSRALGSNTLELGAEDLRVAMTALGRISGRIDVEDLLDVIFAEFCLGK